MKQSQLKDLMIYANTNYEKNGWDNIVECYTGDDAGLLSFFEHCTSIKQCEALVVDIYGSSAVADRCGMSTEEYTEAYGNNETGEAAKSFADEMREDGHRDNSSDIYEPKCDHCGGFTSRPNHSLFCNY